MFLCFCLFVCVCIFVGSMYVFFCSFYFWDEIQKHNQNNGKTTLQKKTHTHTHKDVFGNKCKSLQLIVNDSNADSQILQGKISGFTDSVIIYVSGLRPWGHSGTLTSSAKNMFGELWLCECVCVCVCACVCVCVLYDICVLIFVDSSFVLFF